ncbi:MAG: asparagine synthetase B [Lachnospiraceae bacterium]|nr:asparagine synthetase B [Lachnospiraceae bacterium]
MIHVVIYRGHIRNHRALCETLGIDGALPRRQREEAILAGAYEAYGDQAGLHLHGMFACVLRDDKTDTLFLMRDPFGTKPLYYYLTADNRLLYGTMIREITSQDGFVKKLNERALQQYMSLTYAGGEETFFEGLMKLMPGHTMTVKKGQKPVISRYWKPAFRADKAGSAESFAEELDETLRVIMAELEDDREVTGSFLSGGVDSSYVLAVSGAREAFAVGYDDERFDESRLAEETASLLKRSFNRLTVSPEDYFGIVPFVMEHMEQPLGDASAIAFALGCRAAKDRMRALIPDGQDKPVIYSGEGSDEFFGGYNVYRNAKKYGPLLKTFYAGNTNIMKEAEKKALLARYEDGLKTVDVARPVFDEDKGLDALTVMCDVDIRIWLEGDIYLNVDKMSEAAGIEVRMPLTDRRIFDIASRVPSKLKVNAERNKIVLRTAAAKHLPEDIAFRKKLGFVVPIRHWLADERYNGDVRRLLQSDRAALFFKPDALRKLYEDYTGGNSDLWRRVWAVYVFLVWHELYF